MSSTDDFGGYCCPGDAQRFEAVLDTAGDALTADQKIRREALAMAAWLFTASLNAYDPEGDLGEAAQTVIEFAHSFELFIRNGYQASTPQAAATLDVNDPELVAARLVDMGLAEGGAS